VVSKRLWTGATEIVRVAVIVVFRAHSSIVSMSAETERN